MTDTNEMSQTSAQGHTKEETIDHILVFFFDLET